MDLSESKSPFTSIDRKSIDLLLAVLSGSTRFAPLPDLQKRYDTVAASLGVTPYDIFDLCQAAGDVVEIRTSPTDSSTYEARLSEETVSPPATTPAAAGSPSPDPIPSEPATQQHVDVLLQILASSGRPMSFSELGAILGSDFDRLHLPRVKLTKLVAAAGDSVLWHPGPSGGSLAIPPAARLVAQPVVSTVIATYPEPSVQSASANPYLERQVAALLNVLSSKSDYVSMCTMGAEVASALKARSLPPSKLLTLIQAAGIVWIGCLMPQEVLCACLATPECRLLCPPLLSPDH